MAHSSVGSAGPDFELADEILEVIPTDPYDQLDLARKITSLAIASRVSKLETELGRMRRMLQEKDSLVSELEEKVSRLDHAHQEADSRLKMALDENVWSLLFFKFSTIRDAEMKEITKSLILTFQFSATTLGI